MFYIINRLTDRVHIVQSPGSYILGQILFIALIFWGIEQLSSYLEISEFIRQFSTLLIHKIFKVALFVLLGISAFFAVLYKVDHEKSNKGHQLKYLILLIGLFLCWILIGIAKGLKYDGFNDAGIIEIITSGIKTAFLAYQAPFSSSAYEALFAYVSHAPEIDFVLAGLTLIVSVFLLFYIVMLFFSFFIRKLLKTIYIKNYPQEASEVGAFFYNGLFLILGLWVIASICGVIWIYI